MKSLIRDLVVAPVSMLGIVVILSIAFVPVRVLDALTGRDETERLCQWAMSAIDRYVFADLKYGNHND